MKTRCIPPQFTCNIVDWDKFPVRCSKEDVCKLFCISLPTVNNWIKNGILHPIKIGGIVRFDKEDLMNLGKDPREKGA